MITKRDKARVIVTSKHLRKGDGILGEKHHHYTDKRTYAMPWKEVSRVARHPMAQLNEEYYGAKDFLRVHFGVTNKKYGI